MRRTWILLVVLALSSLGCDSGGGSGGAADTSAPADTPPGVLEIEVGAAWGPIEAAMSEAPRIFDLGALGARFEAPAHGVAGLLTGTGDDATVVSVEGTAWGGVAVGDPRKAVGTALGDPIEDLFMDAWWYPEDGLLIEFEDGVVVRVHVFAPPR